MKKAESKTTLPKVSKQMHDVKILQSLRKIIRAVDIHSRKLSMQYDITAPQLISLLVIVDNSPLTIAEISREVHLSPSTLVGIIDRLEAKGFVERQRSEKDRRQVLIYAKKKGKTFAQKAPSPLQETLAGSLNELTPLEQSTISLSLERIVELMEAKEIDAAPILQTGAIDGKPKNSKE
jgi:DNA-binding MarR family transcriptional regulator